MTYNPGSYDRPNYPDPDFKPDNSPRAWIVGFAWLIAVIIFVFGLVSIADHFVH